ncbi:MAG: hypothetical protein ACYDAO_08525 [Thermoplasmataceae archaeon]
MGRIVSKKREERTIEDYSNSSRIIAYQTYGKTLALPRALSYNYKKTLYKE